MITTLMLVAAGFAGGFIFATLFWRKNPNKQALVNSEVDKVAKKM